MSTKTVCFLFSKGFFNKIFSNDLSKTRSLHLGNRLWRYLYFWKIGTDNLVTQPSWLPAWSTIIRWPWDTSDFKEQVLLSSSHSCFTTSWMSYYKYNLIYRSFQTIYLFWWRYFSVIILLDSTITQLLLRTRKWNSSPFSKKFL